MKTRRLVVAMLLLVIALSGLTVARRGLAPADGQEPVDVRPPSVAPRGASPADRYEAILEEARRADDGVAQEIREVPAEGKAARLLRRQELRRSFADRFLALAGELADDPAAGQAVVDALTWVIVQCPSDPRGREAVDRLVRGPIRSEGLADACWRLDAAEVPIAEPVFRAALRDNPHDPARARASLALARSLRRQSERIRPGRDELARAPELVREATALYRDAIARFGGLHLDRETVAQVAEAELFELGQLGVGREAPEIEGPDLQGRPMALSDFRGRVVVLEFWGDW